MTWAEERVKVLAGLITKTLNLAPTDTGTCFGHALRISAHIERVLREVGLVEVLNQVLPCRFSGGACVYGQCASKLCAVGLRFEQALKEKQG